MYYQELLDLGFERNDTLSNDDVFFRQHGYRCYWLEYTLFKLGKPGNEKVHIIIEWFPWKNKFEMITYIKSDVESRKEITKEEMETIVKVNKRSGDLPNDYVNYPMAC